jgi:hypothetical protein
VLKSTNGNLLNSRLNKEAFMPNTKVEELQRLQTELENTEDLIATTSDRLNSQIQMRRSIYKRIVELSEQVQKESLFSSVRSDVIA